MSETIEAEAIEARPAWEILPEGDYCIVELFGHTTLVGRMSEVERFGTKMLAIEPLFRGQLLDCVLHGGAAIYRLTACSREVAWARQPKNEWNLPAAIQSIVPPKLLEAPASDVSPTDDGQEDLF